MVAIGIFYLAFEDYVLADFSTVRRRSEVQKRLNFSRLLTGIQVSLEPNLSQDLGVVSKFTDVCRLD